MAISCRHIIVFALESTGVIPWQTDWIRAQFWPWERSHDAMTPRFLIQTRPGSMHSSLLHWHTTVQDRSLRKLFALAIFRWHLAFMFRWILFPSCLRSEFCWSCYWDGLCLICVCIHVILALAKLLWTLVADCAQFVIGHCFVSRIHPLLVCTCHAGIWPQLVCTSRVAVVSFARYAYAFYTLLALPQYIDVFDLLRIVSCISGCMGQHLVLCYSFLVFEVWLSIGAKTLRICLAQAWDALLRQLIGVKCRVITQHANCGVQLVLVKHNIL